MLRKTLNGIAVVILICLSFWAGTAFQNERYTDKCLDMGDVSQLHFTLKPETASQLKNFTEKSIGQDLDIWFGGDVVSSVKIVEAVQGRSIILVLPEPVLEKLAKQFSDVE